MKNNTEQVMKEKEHAAIDTAAEVLEEAGKTAAKETVKGYQKIEKGVVDGYKKIETGVVEGYKKIEKGVVDGFEKVTDKCVEVLFAREGESVEDAKKRLSGENKE